MSLLDIVVSKTSVFIRDDDLGFSVPYADVHDLEDAVERFEAEMTQRDVTRVRFTSDQLGVVVLDRHGRPLYEVLWADDQRSADDAAWCNKKYPADWWVDRIGEIPQTRHGITKLSWLHRSEPGVWDEMAQVCGIDDVVRGMFTRIVNTRIVLAEETMTRMGWGSASQTDPDVLALLDKDRDWSTVIPPIVPVGTVIGSRGRVEIVT